MKNRLIILLLTAIMLASCNENVDDATYVDSLPPIFPDYTEVTIPVGIAPLNFGGSGDTDRMDVLIKGSKEGELHVQDSYAAFEVEEWHQLLNSNKGGKITCTVCIKVDGEWSRYRDFDIHISEKPLSDYGLTYRRIAPGYEVYSRMGLYERQLSTFDERALIENTQVPGMCVNCHASNRTNPNKSLFHVRGNHGATVIQQNGETELLQAINDSLKGAMVYPYWHPQGRYCAFSTNQTRQGFHVVKDERVEVFDLSSDVIIYDTFKRELILDTLLMKPEYSENIPVFSPDGKTLYYTTALQQDYPANYKKQQYSLCRIGFDAEEGKLDGRVDTLFNAAKENKSLTWPRPSYDGKYIMFSLIDYGYFSIWHKESDLWLMNVETNEMFPLQGANSDDADSYPNWSADSDWFVFTSRREDGLYSFLYLSSIDADGKATKPFLLPQKNPKEYYIGTAYSFNTPDFTSSPVDIDSRSVSTAIESDRRVKTNIR